jgi:uncharacterized protein (TIGR02301 family)
MSKLISVLAALIWLGASCAALAQESTPTLQRSQGETTQQRLLRLSELLGELHYVRSLCEPNDPGFWRDRMNEMIRLEKPPIQQRNNMINQFNAGYTSASYRFTACTAQAKSYASTAAREGQSIAQQLGTEIDTGGEGQGPG